MTAQGLMAALEAAYLAARNAHDHLDVARVRGEPADLGALEEDAALASADVRRRLADVSQADAALDLEDRRALRAMRDGIDASEAFALPVPTAGPAPTAGSASTAGGSTTARDPGDGLRQRLEEAFGATAASLRFGDEALPRLQILARLAIEPDATARRALFLALEPLWRCVDGDGLDGSPYRVMVAESAAAWRAGRSPLAATARTLGVTVSDVETWAVTTLAAWRAAVVEPARARREPPIEPWDWWWRAGSANRALRAALPVAAVLEINRAVHASLGADLDALGITFDLSPRAARASVPIAFTTFDGRPHRRDDGTWSPGRPTVIASCTQGGLVELAELLHETGHAIHIAGIRTRPAFADWPDSDALTEGVAELVSLDVAESAWQRRWIPDGVRVPETLAIRCQYADVVLDAAWALFELRMHASADRLPNDVWTEITSVWLGVARHPEWSWWAMRGQLVESPGYMANYAIGAVIAADLRAAIRAARGDWMAGDPGWYPWVREHVFRFGLERSPVDVLQGVLGRPPTADALMAQIARGGRPR